MNLVITGDSQRSDVVEHEEYSSQVLMLLANHM